MTTRPVRLRKNSSRKLKTKSARINWKKKVEFAFKNESDPKKLRKLFTDASSKLKYCKALENLHRKYLELYLPKAPSKDNLRIDLRKWWIEGTILLRKNMSSRFDKVLMKKGYKKTLIDQVNGKNILKDNFKIYAKIKKLEYTAEYLVYNFFEEDIKLQATKHKIINQLNVCGCKITKHEVASRINNL